jgi:phytanoyl-CoA hydroxylase
MVSFIINEKQKQFYDENGYLVVEQLFNPDEIVFYRDHYMHIRAAGTYPGDDSGVQSSDDDPLRRYPRLINMHRWDDTSLNWMLDERIKQHLTSLVGREPFAVQTMVYFKPPKSRGQALHQDNYYLRVQPGTCIAAWLALDPCDEANGCMQVVPGSHNWPLLCPVQADISQSFTDVTVPLPPDQEIRPINMNAGDVLFFNGSLVHGSFPNVTEDRFRRALIGHYIEGDTQKVYEWYHPVLRMDGSEVVLENSPGGGKCGIWKEPGNHAELTGELKQPGLLE